jgi:hypothetical protein
MPAAQYNFATGGCQGGPLEVGATFSNQLIWQAETPPGSEIYVPVDITGYTAKMQVKKKVGAPLVLELSTANQRITLDPTNGILNLVVSAADTALLVPGLYRYDLDLTDQAGFVTRFIQGAFEIVGTITT